MRNRIGTNVKTPESFNHPRLILIHWLAASLNAIVQFYDCCEESAKLYDEKQKYERFLFIDCQLERFVSFAFVARLLVL